MSSATIKMIFGVHEVHGYRANQYLTRCFDLAAAAQWIWVCRRSLSGVWDYETLSADDLLGSVTISASEQG